VRRAILRAQLLLVACTSILGGLGGIAICLTGVESVIEGPFIKEEGLTPALLNSLLFVALLFAGALMILVILIKLRKASLLKLLASFSLSSAAFLVCEVYAYALVEEPAIAIDLLSLGISALTLYAVLKHPLNPVSAALQLAVGSLLGPILAFMVAPLSLLLMLLAASLYDLYAVHRGPLKRVLEETSSRGGRNAPPILSPLTVSLGGVTVGMGDVILYSSMIALSLTRPNLDFLRYVVVLAALYTGVYLTFKLLERRRYVAALPIPMLLSILAYTLYLTLKM